MALPLATVFRSAMKPCEEVAVMTGSGVKFNERSFVGHLSAVGYRRMVTLSTFSLMALVPLCSWTASIADDKSVAIPSIHIAQRKAAMSSPGSAEHGRQIFFSESLKCATCHKVDGKGGDAGPDLSLVAGKFDRPHLIEAVLDPSAQILEGYRTTIVVLKDGRSLAGIVVSPTKEGFTLVDATNKRTIVANSEVEERSHSAVSLMPANVAASLSPADFTDLIAYLDTLLAGRRSNPGEGITVTVTLPDGLQIQEVAGRLTGCTAMDIAPDGRIFVCEQTGATADRQESTVARRTVREVDCGFHMGTRPAGSRVGPRVSSETLCLCVLCEQDTRVAPCRQSPDS